MCHARLYQKAGRRFFDEHSPDWVVSWDTRSDRPNLIRGRGVAFVPGVGNSLVPDSEAGGPTLDELDALARDFMGRHPDLFRVDQLDLVRDDSQSGNFGSADGLTDGADPDCFVCLPVGASCTANSTANSDCCGNKCKGKAGSQTCR